MSSNSVSKLPEVVPVEEAKAIPVYTTETATFNDTYASMAELFKQEMKLFDQHMNVFSTNLVKLCGNKMSSIAEWLALKSSPLVVDEGQGEYLRLKFDVSQFEVNEIKAQVLNDVLFVTASHEEQTNNTSVCRKFDRRFQMPPGTNPNQISCTLASDGVLTVQAPLKLPTTVLDSQEDSVD